MSETGFIPHDPEAVDTFIARFKRMDEGITPMPKLRDSHMVNLSDYVTVDQVPLTSDDIDTAIKIANGTEDDFYQPVVRERSVELNTMTLHLTSAGDFERYNVNSALRYLAKRPAGPVE